MEGKFSVYIDEKEFVLEEKSRWNKKKNDSTSGVCYHLQEGDFDLSVKIYHKEDPLGEEYPWYPDELSLQKFIQLSPNTYPVLLSQYMVRDFHGEYIGCARECIYPAYENTVDAIFDLPKEHIFPYFQAIQDTIPSFDQAGIVLGDWNSYNVMLGKTRTLPTSLFVFDDSDYTFSNTGFSSNQSEFEHLLEDLVEAYLGHYHLGKKIHSVLDGFNHSKSHMQFLHDISKDTETIGDGVFQYIRKY